MAIFVDNGDNGDNEVLWIMRMSGIWRILGITGRRNAASVDIDMSEQHSFDMPRPPLKIVIARAMNGVIGCDNKLPWHLPEDLKRFKKLTQGTAMIMGRRTFDSLPGLLPGRRHIVLTRNPDWSAEGAEVVHSREEAIERLHGEPGSVIGGAEIFALFLPIVDSIELTEIGAKPRGDTTIVNPRERPEFSQRLIQEFKRENEKPSFKFWTLDRKQDDFDFPDSLLARRRA
jgi:dihydrofolate reductase